MIFVMSYLNVEKTFKKMVDREESTKLPFDWNDHIIFKELKEN